MYRKSMTLLSIPLGIPAVLKPCRIPVFLRPFGVKSIMEEKISLVYSEKIHGTSRSVSQRCWTRKKKPYKFLHIILRSERECEVREYTAEEQWLLTKTES
ncbi:hypothetical protein Tco_0427452 [Tanacetum coccineum]